MVSIQSLRLLENKAVRRTRAKINSISSAFIQLHCVVKLTLGAMSLNNGVENAQAVRTIRGINTETAAVVDTLPVLLQNRFVLFW